MDTELIIMGIHPSKHLLLDDGTYEVSWKIPLDAINTIMSEGLKNYANIIHEGSVWTVFKFDMSTKIPNENGECIAKLTYKKSVEPWTIPFNGIIERLIELYEGKEDPFK